MVTDPRLPELRERWERAIERDRHADAVKALVELEAIDREEPLWSHRLGESYRRLHKMKEAEEAFVRATERYAERGFLPRAIAMAKLVVSINPKRTDVLSRVQPKPSAPAPPPLPARPVVVPLAPAKDSSADK